MLRASLVLPATCGLGTCSSLWVEFPASFLQVTSLATSLRCAHVCTACVQPQLLPHASLVVVVCEVCNELLLLLLVIAENHDAQRPSCNLYNMSFAGVYLTRRVLTNIGSFDEGFMQHALAPFEACCVVTGTTLASECAGPSACAAAAGCSV